MRRVLNIVNYCEEYACFSLFGIVSDNIETDGWCRCTSYLNGMQSVSRVRDEEEEIYYGLYATKNATMLAITVLNA